jgi:hypothetical protein
MRKLIERFTIFGCDARGDGDSAYLTRYRFPRIGPFRPALHVFHRSDHDEMHDHPWPFVSVILWRGYIEETPSVCGWRDVTEWDIYAMRDNDPGAEVSPDGRQIRFRRRKRVWPGMVLLRRATHVHRVELVDGKRAVTLVVMGPRVREWGFWVGDRWQVFREYFKERGC